MTSDSGPKVDVHENGVEDVSSAATSQAMQERQAMFAVLAQIAESLRRLFDPFCEVVIHEFSDFEHSIIHLEGDVTNRKLGGAATDLLLSKAQSGDTDEDLHNYLTSLAGGRLMKSSTVFLRDETGRAYGAFCVNDDISAFVSVRKILGAFVSTEDQGDIVETFSDDIEETIQSLLTDTLHEVGKGQPLMSREEKIDLIARLDERGIFQVKKAVPILADQLGLSRATVYNYLREAREEK